MINKSEKKGTEPFIENKKNLETPKKSCLFI